MKEHYIIDGYNCIYAWKELQPFLNDWAAARDKFIDIVQEYGAYEKFYVTVVFDAGKIEDEEKIETYSEYFEVIFTAFGETADSRIEKLAYESVRKNREVHVVSSDAAVESMILGAGAYRHPAQEFRRTVRRTKQHLREKYLSNVTLPLIRHEVSDKIDAETLAKLDELRRR